ARNDAPGCRSLDQFELQGAVVIIIQQVADPRRERLGFGNDHRSSLRQRRTILKGRGPGSAGDDATAGDMSSGVALPTPGFPPAPPVPTRGYGTAALRARLVVGSAPNPNHLNIHREVSTRVCYPLKPQDVEESPEGGIPIAPGGNRRSRCEPGGGRPIPLSSNPAKGAVYATG